MNFSIGFDENSSFPILPEGIYQVAFAGVEDLGMKPKFQSEELEPKMAMYFYTAEEELSDGSVGRVILRSKPMSMSDHIKSTLSTYMVAIMGGKVDRDVVPEGTKKDLDQLVTELIGNNVSVTTVIQQDAKGRDWANIASIAPVASKRRRDVDIEGFVKPERKEKENARAAFSGGVSNNDDIDAAF